MLMKRYLYIKSSQIAKFMGATRGPPGSCRPQLAPMLAPWTLLSGMASVVIDASVPNRQMVMIQAICEKVWHFGVQAWNLVILIIANGFRYGATQVSPCGQNGRHFVDAITGK